MLKKVYTVLSLFSLGVFFLSGCRSSNPSQSAESFFNTVQDPKAAERIEFSSSGVSFGMRCVPGGITFPMDFYDYGIMRLTMEKPYWIAETEVTYELWKKVYDWAVSGKDKKEGSGSYTFIHTGRQGADSSLDGEPVGNKYHPVTNISWRDALIWCNALTEWYNAKNGTKFTCVYYSDAQFANPLRSVDGSDDYPCIITPGTQDNPFVDPGADGFRLPSRDEWVLAAVYQGENTVNAEEDFAYPYFTDAPSASGASANFRDEGETGKFAWYSINSGGSTKASGSAGTDGTKPLTGNPNFLGIYDMSGNVMEFSFDWYRPGEMGWCFKTIHNGSWAGTGGCQIINVRMNILPYDANNFTGFRFARNFK